MSPRPVVVATTSFHSEFVKDLVGKHPAVVPGGVIQQGTRLYADDPIALRHPDLFVSGDTVPSSGREPTSGPARGGPVPGDGLTRARIVAAVIENREPDGSWPTQATVAEALHLKDGRRIRQVQGQAGWQGILADAERLATG